MAESSFLPYADVERFLAFTRPELKDIALELRNLVFSVCPEATERILWGGISYHNANHGGPVKGAICQIELATDHVRISFIHGVRLSNPDGLLTGDRLSKRYVAIDSYEQAPWDAIRRIIEEAAKLNPSSFDPLPSSAEES